MKTSLSILLILTTFGCASNNKVSVSQGEVVQYCQDLNTILQRVQAITSNIVNVNTTRVAAGGVYKRKVTRACSKGFCRIEEDNRSPIMKYEPTHPDARENGYVNYPNINLDEEKAYLVQMTNTLEAVLHSFPLDNRTFFFKDPRANECFSKYPNVNATYNYRKNLGR